MQTTQSTTNTASGITSKIIRGIRSLLGGGNHQSDDLVSTCAGAIRRVRGLADWVGSLEPLSQRERAPMLLRAAGSFHSEFSGTDLTNALHCMAEDSGLFVAVKDALQNHPNHTTSFTKAA